jgi:hypothetical protein
LEGYGEFDERVHSPRVKRFVTRLLLVASLGLTTAAQAALAQDDPVVSVSVDASSYAPGDSVTATVNNGSSLAISPNGGIVCQASAWPFSLQVLDDSGVWQDVPVARTPPCIAIAAALLQPGQSVSKTFAAAPDTGEYRVVYAFHATDGTDGVAASEPFMIQT